MASDPFLDSALCTFLLEHQVKSKDGEMSMTAMTPGLTHQCGRWYVSDTDYPKFLDLLHEYLHLKNFKPLTLVEKRLTDSRTPLLIDLDFKYPIEKSLKHSFGKQEILTFIQSVASCLKHFFDLKDKKGLRFFVTLRPEAYQAKKPNGAPGKIVKDGIHISCPDIILTTEQQKVVRSWLLEKSAIATAFKETGYTNPEAEIFDETMANKGGWQFYGESKKDVEHPYQVVHIFKYSPKTAKFSEEKLDLYDARNLMEILSIRFDIKDPAKVKTESLEEFDALAMTTNVVVNTTQPVELVAEEWTNVLASVHPESEIDMAKRLVLECLSVQRADNYHSWIQTGWCIRNIDSSTDGFDMWMEFSKKSPKFSENEMDKLKKDWVKGSMMRSYNTRSLGFGSLVRWAQEDNLEKFKEIKNDDILNYIKKVALSFKGGTHHHVADIMRRVFGDNYKCSVEHRSNEWFRFMEHVWEPLPQGLELKGKMSNIIADLVDDARRSYRNLTEKKKNLTPEEIENENKKMMMFLKLQENLFNANFKENVMKECVQAFYDEQFGQKMNMNGFLVGCANGILHLRDPIEDDNGKLVGYKVTFKPGKPDDYISFLAGKVKPELEPLEYIPYDPANPEIIEIIDFFKKLFPDNDVREYVLTLASSCLEGQNREQCYYIMTGVGGNGKTKFVDLMRNTLGDYTSSLSTTALTRKRPDSGSANPDIINIKNKRFIIMQEPDEREQLNTARMKQFSGEDIVEARGLFKDQEQFKITGKFFMSCNRLPPIHSMDDGTWRRIRVIPFKSRFVPPGDPNINAANNVYPRDSFLDEKLKNWRGPFLGLLVHYYETRYMKDGIKSVPKEVKKFSDEYKQSYDSFAKFRDNRLRDASTAKPELRLSLMEHNTLFKNIRSAYRMWAQDTSVGSKGLTENELRIRCQDAFGTPADGKTFKGVRIFNSDEEIEAFDSGLVVED